MIVTAQAPGLAPTLVRIKAKMDIYTCKSCFLALNLISRTSRFQQLAE